MIIDKDGVVRKEKFLKSPLEKVNIQHLPSYIYYVKLMIGNVQIDETKRLIKQ